MRTYLPGFGKAYPQMSRGREQGPEVEEAVRRRGEGALRDEFGFPCLLSASPYVFGEGGVLAHGEDLLEGQVFGHREAGHDDLV